MTTVSVFGGTGFLGRRLVRRLATEGATVRVECAAAQRAGRRPGRGWPGSGPLLYADVRDQPPSPPPLSGPTPSSTRSPPMSRKAV